MGTADEFSMDILINALTTVSKECAPACPMLDLCWCRAQF